MKNLAGRMPSVVAAPILAVLALVGGLLAAVATLVVLACGAVSWLAFLATAFNLVGYLALGNISALKAAGITGLVFVAAFSVPILIGNYTSQAFRAARSRRRPLRVQLAQDAPF